MLLLLLSPITSLRSVETLDLHAKAPQWIEGISMSHGRNGHGLASTGGRIFAVGGIDLAGKTTGTTESYSPGEDAWVAGPPLRTPRSFLGLAAMHGKLYAAGGYAANGAALSSVVILARDSHGPGRWATLQCAMLSARASHRTRPNKSPRGSPARPNQSRFQKIRDALGISSKSGTHQESRARSSTKHTACLLVRLAL